jgi:hypothetical protein
VLLKESYSFSLNADRAPQLKAVVGRTLMPTTKMSLETAFREMDETCIVMIDRSNLFAKSFGALSDRNFRGLVDRYPELRGVESQFREPVTYAFSYAQRVFLCSAIEACLVYHHANSVALLIQRVPDQIPRLANVLEFLRKRKWYGVKTLDQWIALDWKVQLTHLRELSFSNLQTAGRFFDDVYGGGCFDTVWGADVNAIFSSRYADYQLLRNGILHRGGETSSGDNIPAAEKDFEGTFEDALSFRDAILALSAWCYDWWRKKRYSTVH